MDLTKYIICIILNLLLFLTSYTQTPASSTTRDGSSYDIATNSTLGLHNFGKRTTQSYDDIDGSPYFIDDYVRGNAVLANGHLEDSLLLKYDLATYTFLAKLDDNSEISIDSRSVIEYRFFNQGEEFLFKRVNPKYPDIFYEIIYEGNDLTLYKNIDIKKVVGQELGISKTNDRFSRQVKYYIRQGMEIKRVKLKKKNIWKYLDSEQKQMLDNYAVDENIKLKKESDFKKLLSILKKA